MGSSADIQKALQESIDLFNQKKKASRRTESNREVLGGVLNRCKSCRENFRAPVMTSLCPTCESFEQARYDELRDYLFTHPGTPMDFLCDKFSVSRETIRKYLKEYRLEIAGEVKSTFLTCERCRTPIKSGRFCERCESASGKQGLSQFESSTESKFRSSEKRS